MKKISGRIIALLLTVIMASGTVVSADVNSDIKSAKQEAKVARDVLEKYESDLTSLNKQKKDAETKLKQAEKAVKSEAVIYSSYVFLYKSYHVNKL